MNAKDFWWGLTYKIVQLIVMAAFAWYFAYKPGSPLGWVILIAFAVVFAFKAAHIAGAIIGFYMIRNDNKRGAQTNGRAGNNSRIAQR